MKTPTLEELAACGCVSAQNALEKLRDTRASLYIGRQDKDLAAWHKPACEAFAKGVVDAYLSAIGEGMPSVDDMINEYAKVGPVKASFERAHNLLLTAHAAAIAKVKAEHEAEVEKLKYACNRYAEEEFVRETQLEAVRALMTHWFKSETGTGYVKASAVLNECGKELQKALATPQPAPITHNIHSAYLDAEGWCLFDVKGDLVEEWPKGWEDNVDATFLRSQGVMIAKSKQPAPAVEPVPEVKAGKYGVTKGWFESRIAGEIGQSIEAGVMHPEALGNMEKPKEHDQPPAGLVLHNPHGIAPDKIGPDHRLLATIEQDGRHRVMCDKWNETEQCWDGHYDGVLAHLTYRVPISTPWPEAPEAAPTAEELFNGLKAAGYSHVTALLAAVMANDAPSTEAAPEKWAAERKAHAEGKRIEVRYLDPVSSKQGWILVGAPFWEEGKEYRIAPGQDSPESPANDMERFETWWASHNCDVEGFSAKYIAAAAWQAARKDLGHQPP